MHSPADLHHRRRQKNLNGSGLLRDVRILAGHAPLNTTQRYIEADVGAQPYLIMRVLCIYCTTADGGDGGAFATAGQPLSN